MNVEVRSEDETWDLARKVAPLLKPGDVVCLEGDLGAGKTTFTQGLAAALGVKGRVTSPTFCIVQEHPAGEGGSVPLLVHMDLYRLTGEEDVLDLGWEDYLARGAVLVVEWPERLGSLLPPDALRLKFLHKGENIRTIHIDSARPIAL